MNYRFIYTLWIRENTENPEAELKRLLNKKDNKGLLELLQITPKKIILRTSNPQKIVSLLSLSGYEVKKSYIEPSEQP